MNQSEIRTWLREHHDSSWGWALLCCQGDREEAEDVLHSVYVGLLEGRMSFDGRSSFRTWFFSVVRKTAAKRRYSWLRRLEKLKTQWSGPAESQESAEQYVFRTEIRTGLRELLGKLSTRQRQILQLVFYHDLSIQEAAQVMGVTIGSARTHYERGKSRLRMEMERAGLNYDPGTGRLSSSKVL
jgi:RNA polymerase sigma-70 factor (ECF subfamily)